MNDDTPGSFFGLVFGLIALVVGVIWAVASGFFYLLSTPVEAKRVNALEPATEAYYEFTPTGGTAPIRGKLIDKTPAAGSPIPIRYLDAYPEWNSEDRPLAILGGPVALAVVGFITVLLSGGFRSTTARDPEDTPLAEDLQSGKSELLSSDRDP